MHTELTASPTQELMQPIDSDSSISAMILDSDRFGQMMAFAEMMAKGVSTVPKHLQGNVGDCMAVSMQAVQWGMSPFVVAQKTHIVNGTLGYEAQLVNAVISTCGALEGRPDFIYDEEWKEYKGMTIPKNMEPKLGVTVVATIKGQSEPKRHYIVMSEAIVRNSPLWKSQPSLQLAYLCVKQFARLYVPDAILGVYTPDELGDQLPATTARRKPASGVLSQIGQENNKPSNIQDGEIVEPLSLSDFKKILTDCKTIECIENAKSEGVKLSENDKEAGIKAFQNRKSEIEKANKPASKTFAQINDLIMVAKTASEVNEAYESSTHLDDEARAELKANAGLQLKALA